MNDLKNNNKIIITTLISSLIIVIGHNLKIDSYIKNIIIPSTILLFSYLFLLKDKDNLNKKAYCLLIPIILILISNLLISIDFSNKFLNIFIIPIVLSIFFFSLINENYRISSSSIKWIFDLFPRRLFSNLKYIKFKNSKYNNILNIIIGIIIGGFSGFIILMLLIGADDYFKAFISNITNLFNFDIGNIILFIIYFILLFSIFINILLNKNKKIEETNYKKFDETMITIILSIINIVFILFLVSELSKLTVNFLKIPIEYTYSSYAREGFFQLLIVTTINFSIIMYLLYKTEIIKNSKVVKNLILLLIAFSIILIFNSYYRMFLYTENYGFTVLRLQVLLFLTMELLLFSCLIKKIINSLKNKDSYIYFLIVIGFYIINLYLCNNSFINLINN